MLSIAPFLTAYDPSDLPGGSVDPLGFERGYLFLADKILPGLTNVANRPRYFSLLCAGVVLADEAVPSTASDRQRKQFRIDCIKRIEKFCALGSVLAAEKSREYLNMTGLRGIRDAKTQAKYLQEHGFRDTNADFRLLSRQEAYGVLGIYAAISEGMLILDRDTLALTPDLGFRLGEAFLKETQIPKQIREAVIEKDKVVRLSTLADWGIRARLAGPVLECEKNCLREALQQNPVRWRMAQTLIAHRAKDNEPELLRLQRITKSLAANTENADLREAIQTILAYETCYCHALLGFQRLLWMCQAYPPFQIDLAGIANDDKFTRISTHLREAYGQLANLLRMGATEAFCRDLHRLADVGHFLEEATSVTGVRPFVEVLLRRHRDVQRKKFDGGRPKMPWLEVTGDFIRPTLGRALQVDREPTGANQIAPHAYRIASADALIHAAGLA